MQSLRKILRMVIINTVINTIHGRLTLDPARMPFMQTLRPSWDDAFVTGRMQRSGKLPVLNVLTGQKIRFFAPQGRLVAPIHVKIGTTDGHVGSLVCAKSHLNRRMGWECSPKISKISSFW